MYSIAFGIYYVLNGGAPSGVGLQIGTNEL